MKYLITYSSQSGNTEKLARSLGGSLPGQAEIKPLAEASDLADYQAVVVGFWLKGGQPDPQTAEFLARVGSQKLFLFATHGAAAGSDHVNGALAAAKKMADRAEVVGSFTCQGEVNPDLLAKLKASGKAPVWIADADAAVGHPDQADLEAFQKSVKAAFK